MRRGLRLAARTDGTVEAQRIAASLGAQVRARRRQLRISQAELGRRIGLTQSRVSDVERGRAVGLPLGIWVALGIALGVPLAVSFSRPTRAEDSLADAGHLEVQEYLLEIGRRSNRRGAFELATRPSAPGQSIDVCHEDRRHLCLIIQEAWIRIGDLGGAARGSTRKVADVPHDPDWRVALCWVVRDTHANREIVRRYPEIIAARFPGSSAGWVRALEHGDAPPFEPGLVWFDPSRRRLRPMRLRQRS